MLDGQRVKLGDVAHLGGGHAFKSGQYTDSGRFVLRTVNITDGYSITKEGATFISEADAANYERFALREHDTLFVMVAATLGKIGYVREGDLPALLNQNMWVIRAKDDLIDPIYLHYLFREISKIPLSWVGGSARSFLRRDDVRNLEFDLPERGAQESIGAALKAFDDKIELNQRMNEALEAMAQAIFRDWFVDFGPTRRKMEGATDPVAILGGLTLNPEKAVILAALFPATLGADGLPEGWQPGMLGTLAKQAANTVTPTEIDPSTPYIGLEHMPRRSIALNSWGAAEKVTSNKSHFLRGQILFGKLRPYFHKVGSAPLDGICSTDIVVVDARKEMDRALVLACVSTPEFVAFTDQSSTGTKMPRTSWKTMQTYPLVKTDKGIREAFSEMATPMLAKIEAAIHENNTLALTRDLLLPKLISGEVRLRDLEAIA